MGTFKATFEVGDPQGSRYRALEATIDTGATYTMILDRSSRRYVAGGFW